MNETASTLIRFKSSVLGTFPALVQTLDWPINSTVAPPPIPDQEIVIRCLRHAVTTLTEQNRAAAVKLEAMLDAEWAGPKWDRKSRMEWGILVCLCARRFMANIKASPLAEGLKAMVAAEENLVEARYNSYVKKGAKT